MKTTSHAFLVFLIIFLAALRAPAAPVDVNTADVETLAKALSGVGPKTAAAIVDYRESNGLFTGPEDLLNVKGVGPRILERNRADILIGDRPGDAISE